MEKNDYAARIVGNERTATQPEAIANDRQALGGDAHSSTAIRPFMP